MCASEQQLAAAASSRSSSAATSKAAACQAGNHVRRWYDKHVHACFSLCSCASVFCVVCASVQATEDELSKERDCVSHLIGRMGGACDIRGAPDTTVPGEN